PGQTLVETLPYPDYAYSGLHWVIQSGCGACAPFQTYVGTPTGYGGAFSPGGKYYIMFYPSGGWTANFVPLGFDWSDGDHCHLGCTACGMPVWSVSEPYVSLWLHDEPLGYQPALGSRISFELAFKQREATAGLSPNIFGVGKRWNCPWL